MTGAYDENIPACLGAGVYGAWGEYGVKNRNNGVTAFVDRMNSVACPASTSVE
jgi:hypothetical protein